MFQNLMHVQSRFLELHPIAKEDVPFIYDLRTQTSKNYLNPISPNIQDQYLYFEKYLERFREGIEIYYKILDKQKNKFCGVVRLTEIDKKDIFNWQSLVIAKGCSPQIGIDIMLVIYSLGFELLNRNVCGPWPVDVRFKEIFQIHNYIGMVEQANEDERFIDLRVTRDRFLQRIGMFRTRGFGVIGDARTAN